METYGTGTFYMVRSFKNGGREGAHLKGAPSCRISAPEKEGYGIETEVC